MPIDQRWDAVDDTQWSSFAEAWLSELEEKSPSGAGEFGGKVTYMMFTARPEQLWKFIRLAVERAATDNQLAWIAAGPVERLLGRYGGEYMPLVEEQAHTSSRFARMLTGVRQYQISGDVWSRVQSLQALCSDHLSTRAIRNCHARFVELEERHLDNLKEALKQRQSKT